MTGCGKPSGYAAHVAARTPACAPCRAAHAERQARWRKRSYLQHGPLIVDATGTVRRLRALAAIGWTWKALADHCGVARQTLQKRTARPTVSRATADRVEQLYRDLHERPGPSPTAARRAAADGWPPPIAWDDDTIDDPATQPYAGQHVDIDEVAVARAVAGQRVALARAERIVVARQLTAAGRSAAEISAVLGVEPRTVVRWRAAA